MLHFMGSTVLDHAYCEPCSGRSMPRSHKSQAAIVGGDAALPGIDRSLEWCVKVPLVASNRVGTEKADSTSITFYGGSFIAGPTGEIKQQVLSHTCSMPCSSFDLRLNCCCPQREGNNVAQESDLCSLGKRLAET